MSNTLRLHSFQSLGTLDGPGVRVVVFLQGCPLRCVCCHNPDTWDYSGGYDISVDELMDKIRRCKPYWGDNGGVTVSGGEPLIQAKQLVPFFKMLKVEGIHTAIDTSGYILNDDVKELLEFTDLVLLDYKYTNSADYIKYTGMEIEKANSFLTYLDEHNIETTLRYVYIPELNDSFDSIKRLSEIKQKHTCINHVELLPFRKLCIEKYKEMNISFPLIDIREATQDEIQKIYNQFPELQ